MFIKSINFSFLKRIFLFTFVIALACILVYFYITKGINVSSSDSYVNSIFESDISGEDFINEISNIDVNQLAEDSENNTESSYIKWVDFKATSSILKKLSDLDISSYNTDIHLNWIELMAYLGTKYGGNFSLFKQSDLDNLVSELKSGKTMDELTENMKLYNYFYQSFDAIFHEYIGEYEIETVDENGNSCYEKKYGLKAYLPIAKGYSFNHYKDFGSSRSYGYKRLHLGNDLMGSIGTPIVAVEGGYVESLGWNQYGGWRVGIRSFDKKRYYYYAHLRKDHPYAKDLVEGQIVQAGDVIGYLGMTGYSTNKNVNNINIPHLHFGIQLIFNEVQKDGVNQIWIDVYEIIEFLRQNASTVYLAYPDTYDYQRKFDLMINE